MNDDLNNLEREIERDLARYAHLLDVSVPAEVSESVRTAAQLELHLAWLGAQPAPVPTPGTLERVRTAVAAELAGARPGRSRLLHRWLTSQGLGSLGAAAMLLLCIGVIWYAGTRKPSTGGGGDVYRLLAAMPESNTDPILKEVQGLAEDLRDDTEVSMDEEEESLSDLVQEMDTLLDEHHPAKSNSDLSRKATGELG